MPVLIKVLVFIPGLLHVYFMYMEMFLWEKPRTLKAFGLSADFAKQTRMMAFNQGLYNGFLALGVFWSLFVEDPLWANQIQVFFLSCIFLAGVVGAKTVSKKIFFVQSIPAMIPLIIVLINLKG